VERFPRPEYEVNVRSFCLAIFLTLGWAGTVPALAGEMTFRFVGDPACEGACGAVVLAEGDIAYGSVDRFRQVASGLPRGVPVILNSGGGNVLGSMLLGFAFRERGAAVLVPRGALCASACTYAFLGGVVRGAPAGARLGVHRFYLAEQAPSNVVLDKKTEADTTALLRRYVAAMGANPELIALAGSVSPSRMHFLTPAELRRYRVVTAVPDRSAGRALRARARIDRSATTAEAALPASRRSTDHRSLKRTTSEPRKVRVKSRSAGKARLS